MKRPPKLCGGFEERLCVDCKRHSKSVDKLVRELAVNGAGRKTCIHFIQRG